ncbi:MAG: DinB family protein [Saprospiraceae bacterium]
MSDSFFQSLPPTPSSLSSGAILSRFIVAIGFRYQTATKGLTQNEIQFRPVEGSMNMLELLDHIYKVLTWGYKAFDKNVKLKTPTNTFDDYRKKTLQVCESFKNRLEEMSDEELEQTEVYLKRIDTTFSFWYLINGPISDVLTHIGQINSWRRIAGNPVDRISPFTGEPF